MIRTGSTICFAQSFIKADDVVIARANATSASWAKLPKLLRQPGIDADGLAGNRPYRAGRSPDWIKVKNRKHPAMSRVADSFA